MKKDLRNKEGREKDNKEKMHQKSELHRKRKGSMEFFSKKVSYHLQIVSYILRHVQLVYGLQLVNVPALLTENLLFT